MATQSSSSDSLFLLEDQTDSFEHLLKIITLTQKQLLIFSQQLNPKLFNHPKIEAALSKLARTSRHSEIKILIQDADATLASHHRLIKLSRRLSSKVSIQKLTLPPRQDFEFVIGDQNKLWYQHHAHQDSGFANYHAYAEAKHFDLLFKDFWKNSEAGPKLRPVYL